MTSEERQQQLAELKELRSQLLKYQEEQASGEGEGSHDSNAQMNALRKQYYETVGEPENASHNNDRSYSNIMEYARQQYMNAQTYQENTESNTESESHQHVRSLRR